MLPYLWGVGGQVQGLGSGGSQLIRGLDVDPRKRQLAIPSVPRLRAFFLLFILLHPFYGHIQLLLLLLVLLSVVGHFLVITLRTVTQLMPQISVFCPQAKKSFP